MLLRYGLVYGAVFCQVESSFFTDRRAIPRSRTLLLWAGEETNQVVTVAGCLSVIPSLFLSSSDIIDLTADKAFVSLSLLV